MMRIHTGLVAALLAAPLAVSVGQGQQASDFRWSDRIATGRTVRVSNVNGTVTFRAGSGDRVEVTAVKRWRRGDPSDVRIYAAREGSDIRVCPLYDDQDDCDDGERRGRRRDGNRYDSDVSVDFTVLVPRGVHVVAATVNGTVSVTGATEDVDATTVNGDVTVESGRGALRATTVSGKVQADVGTKPASIELTTVNGNIYTSLASNIGVDLEMTTVNGVLNTDYDITLRSGRFNPFNVSAHLGPAGGPRMRVTTVNGNVELRKR